MRFPEFSGEWEKELLGTTCNVLMCKRILASQTNAECGVPFYKIGTIGGIPDAYISKELFESYRAKYNYPRKGEVMITCAGTVGKAMIFDGEDSYYQDSNIVWIDNPTNKIDNTFLYHFISKVDWSKLNTTTIVRIYNDDLRQLRISYPTLSEQRKISIFLNLLNQRIETQKKIIEDLKKLKYAISNKVLHACFCNSDCAIQLSSVLNERKEYNENDGTYPHGSLSKEGVTLKSERYDRDFLVKEEDKKYKVSHYNDICYNPANLKFGVISRNKLGSIIFSPIYVTYEINDKYNSEYIELLVTNYEFIGRVRKFEQGTVYERMAVSSEDFLSYKISFPSKNTQDKIADNVRAIDTKLQNELNILDRTEKQKNYLLSQMFI